jgi:outer membrane immunogenic protein
MRKTGRWAVFGLAICGAAFGSLVTSRQAVAQQSDSSNSSYNWSGFYAGGNLGGAFGGSDVLSIIPSGVPFLEGQQYGGTIPPNPATPGIIAAYRSNDIAVSSFTGGVQTGYNFWTGGILVGLEADLNFLNARGSKTTRALGDPSFGPPATLYTFRNEIEAHYVFTARPRIGIPFASGLLYATGGAAVTTLKYEHSFRGTGGFFDGLFENASASETKLGWTAGGGFELPIGRNTTLKAEYLFADFGSISTNGNKINPPNFACGADLAPVTIQGVLLPGPTPRQCFNHQADLTLHTIRMGLNFKF